MSDLAATGLQTANHPPDVSSKLCCPVCDLERRLCASASCRTATTDTLGILPACSIVELVAARDIPQNGEVSICYGDRPLRDFLRGYAFTPDDLGIEVSLQLDIPDESSQSELFGVWVPMILSGHPRTIAQSMAGITGACLPSI